MDEFGEVVTKARIARGWSQADLARVLGIKPQQVQRYESVDSSVVDPASEQYRGSRRGQVNCSLSFCAYFLSVPLEKGGILDVVASLHKATLAGRASVYIGSCSLTSSTFSRPASFTAGVSAHPGTFGSKRVLVQNEKRKLLVQRRILVQGCAGD